MRRGCPHKIRIKFLSGACVRWCIYLRDIYSHPLNVTVNFFIWEIRTHSVLIKMLILIEYCRIMLISIRLHMIEICIFIFIKLKLLFFLFLHQWSWFYLISDDEHINNINSYHINIKTEKYRPKVTYFRFRKDSLV